MVKRPARKFTRRQKGGADSVILPFAKLIQAYDENKDKIYLPWSGQHPINEEAIEHWKDRVSKYSQNVDKKRVYLKFVDLFFDFMRYISFDEYLSKFSDIGKELAERMPMYDKVMIVIDGEASKSNFWVALLLTGELLKAKLSSETIEKMLIVNQSEAVVEYAKEHPDEKILGIHVDDMSYSGRQIKASISHEINDLENVDYVLGVAFIGSAAVELLRGESGEESGISEKDFKLQNTEVIISFVGRLVEMLTKMPEGLEKQIMRGVRTMCSQYRAEYKNGYEAFGCYDSIVPVYFDHKIADGLSTFQKVLLFGSYPRNNETECVREGLIKGCENNPLRNNFNTCRTLFANYEEPGISPCTHAFYKDIKYTYNGANFDSKKNPVEQLSTMAGGKQKRNMRRRQRRTLRKRFRN